MGWKMESFRMSMYISIPIASFYIFNNPYYIEDYVIGLRRKMYPPVDEEQRQKFRDLKANIQQIQKKRIEAELMEFQS